MYSLEKFGNEYIENVILKSYMGILESEKVNIDQLLKELTAEEKRIFKDELYAHIKVNSCKLLESVVQEFGDTENHFLKIGYYNEDKNFIDFDKVSDDFTGEPVFEPYGWVTVNFNKEIFDSFFNVNKKS